MLTIDRAVVDRTIAQRNSFSERLIALTRSSIVDDWKIGRSSDGATLFWYQSVTGDFVNAKKVWYDSESLHRMKGDASKLPQFHYSSRRGFRTCLYGEFQLSQSFLRPGGTCYPTSTPVVLVESEKTAVLMSHYASQYIWIATGGSTGLTRRKASVLRGRTVFILFDCDSAGSRGAERANRLLGDLGIQNQVIDQFELLNEYDSEKGLDIADSVIATLFRERISGPLSGGQDNE
jgi:hypothetical protein